MSLSDLRSSTKKTRQWLANIRAELVNFRHEMTKESKSLGDKDDLKISVQSLIDLAGSGMEIIDDIHSGLKTLSMAPPGLASGIIDFVYMLASGRHQTTEKEKFREKLKALESSMLKLRLRVVEKNMGFKEGSFESYCEALASKYGLGTGSKEEIVKLGHLVIDPAEPATPEMLGGKVENLKQQLTAENPGKDINTKLAELVRDLRVKLAEMAQGAPPSEQSRIKKLIDNIKIANLSTGYILKFSEQDYQKFVGDLKEWQALFNRRVMEGAAHLQNIENQVSNIERTDSELALKYLGLYKALLSRNSNKAITSLLKQIADRTQPIVNALSAIDNKDLDRETLSKNPELAQNANQQQAEKEEEKQQSS